MERRQIEQVINAVRNNCSVTNVTKLSEELAHIDLFGVEVSPPVPVEPEIKIVESEPKVIMITKSYNQKGDRIIIIALVITVALFSITKYIW